MIGLAAQVGPAAATCIEQCFSYSCNNPMDAGCPYRNSCITECNRHIGHPSRSFGAIAYGARSTGGGWAYNLDTAAAANSRALANCRARVDDCELVISFSNSCAAVAAVESRSVFAVGQGATRKQAESRAMSDCASQYGDGCEIEIWTCAQPE